MQELTGFVLSASRFHSIFVKPAP